MIRVCITGIPGTGKTSVCRILSNMEIDCRGLDAISDELECTHDGEVDVDCLNERLTVDFDVAESHYSHMLPCSKVVILECDDAVLVKRLADRKYSEGKILENLETQSADIIFYEALERHPSSKIFRINTTLLSKEEVAERILAILNS